MGTRGPVARVTLANVNAMRGGRTCADFAQRLMGIAGTLHLDESFGVALSRMRVPERRIRTEKS
jgi:hypothetical protein